MWWMLMNQNVDACSLRFTLSDISQVYVPPGNHSELATDDVLLIHPSYHH